MVAEKQYTTQLQAGLGMIPETLELLRRWEPGMGPSALADRVIADGVFARVTARRSRNLAAEMFAPRYLTQGGVKWSPKVGQVGSLTQSPKHDPYVQETTSAQSRSESQGRS